MIKSIQRAVQGCAVALSLLGATTAWAVPSPGPDAFGYTSSGIGSNLRNISGTGTQFLLRDDQVSDGIGIGFDFDFYGNSYDTAYVSSNGFLTFTPTGNNGCCTGQTLGDGSVVSNLIAGLWEDLDTNGGADGAMYYQNLGTEFVVGFYEVGHFPSGDPLTFEMILHQGSNDIELQYGALSTGDFGTHSVGISNLGDADGLQLFLDQGSTLGVLANTGHCISHPNGGGCGSTAAVPEPESFALLSLGFIGLMLPRRRTA